MHGERRPAPPDAAAAPDMGDELRVYVNISGLNRAASQELFWPSRMGRSGGYPCSYVCMSFGLLNVGAMFQCYMQGVLGAHEARHQAILAAMEEHLQEPSIPSEPPEARHRSGS